MTSLWTGVIPGFFNTHDRTVSRWIPSLRSVPQQPRGSGGEGIYHDVFMIPEDKHIRSQDYFIQ